MYLDNHLNNTQGELCLPVGFRHSAVSCPGKEKAGELSQLQDLGCLLRHSAKAPAWEPAFPGQPFLSTDLRSSKEPEAVILLMKGGGR